jgi:hypothetical protein
MHLSALDVEYLLNTKHHVYGYAGTGKVTVACEKYVELL